VYGVTNAIDFIDSKLGMNSIVDDIKQAFYRRENGLMQLILINGIVFVLFLLLNVFLTLAGKRTVYEAILDWVMIPASPGVWLSRPWTIITYFFLHEGFFHILFNMLFLYWFGIIVQQFIGDRKVVNLYILGGLAGGVLYIALYNLISYYQDKVDSSAMLGASAGVYAVVLGAATLVPDYQMHLLLIGPVRIKWIALFYVLISLSGIVGANAGGNIAHLGGAIVGFFFIKSLQSGSDWGKPLDAVLLGIKQFFIKKPKVKVSYRATAKPTTEQSKKTGDPSQAEIDAILDKISQKGYESLSKEEKQKLFSASQKK
jgi:membrane associated rhomboid family serine protease